MIADKKSKIIAYRWTETVYRDSEGRSIVERTLIGDGPTNFARFAGSAEANFMVMGQPRRVQVPAFEIEATDIDDAFARFDATMRPIIERITSDISKQALGVGGIMPKIVRPS